MQAMISDVEAFNVACQPAADLESTATISVNVAAASQAVQDAYGALRVGSMLE
jgi:hypothetical protein